jgi:peptide-methionine (S)-S-oxide reductase
MGGKSMFMRREKLTGLPSAEAALPGRASAMPVPAGHFVHGQPLVGPFPGCTPRPWATRQG